MPTLDEAIRMLPEILERLERIEGLLQLERAERHADGPVFDIDALRARGYSQHQAYSILRAYGVKRAGRLRITREQLRKYENAAE